MNQAFMQVDVTMKACPSRACETMDWVTSPGHMSLQRPRSRNMVTGLMVQCLASGTSSDCAG
jgi:hypothetical protein